jgi:biotin synthase
MSLENRKRCLYDLKETGFQVGAGFMVGSPFQTAENLAEDLLFLKELQPQMVGIGPFIPHCDTPFKEFQAGRVDLTITMLALTRLMLPKCLLPATTALGTIARDGRKRGFMAVANVVMPNLSPLDFRKNYALYNDKAYTGDEAAESIKNISENVKKLGLEIDFSRGDNVDFVNKHKD